MFLTKRAGDDRSPFGNFWFEPIGTRTASGQRVSAESAMRLAAVYACVNILAKTFAVLPFKLYQPGADGGRTQVTDHWLYSLFARRPNKFQNPFEWRQMLMGHLALRGNCYNRIIANGAGEITDLLPLHPDRVRIEILPSGEYRYRVKNGQGTEDIVARGDMWHVRWLSNDGVMGISPIDCARETVGIGLASQEYGSRFFQNDARPGGGWIEHPSQFKDKTARDNFRNSWQEFQSGSNRHKSAVLEGGMKYHDLAINNEQAQFLETRKFSVSDVARMFGVPPHLVGDLDKATFSNIEQQSIEFVTYTMTPITESWEASIGYSLLEDDSDLDPEFDLARLLRGDQAARGQFYTQMFQLGALSTNDIRVREGDNPVEGGDERYVPVNLHTLEQAALPPPVAPTPAAPAAPAKPPQAERLDALAEAAAERILRAEASGKADNLEKHARFVAEVLGVSLDAAEAYVAADVSTDEKRTLLTRLARGET